MDKIKDLLNPGWIGASIGLAAILISLILHWIGRTRNKGLICQSSETPLVDYSKSSVPNEKIFITFDGIIVPRVSACEMVIWNNGGAAIRDTDIPSTLPIAFTFGDDTKILEANILKSSREGNLSRIEIDPISPNKIRYSFEFLDKHDGVWLRILHTGKSEKPKLDGAIIDAPDGIKMKYFRKSISYDKRMKMFTQPMMMLAIGMIAVGTTLETGMYFSSEKLPLFIKWMSAFTSIVAIAVFFGITRSPELKIPESLFPVCDEDNSKMN